MSLFQHLLQLSTSLRQVWPPVVLRCALWWNRLLSFIRWQAAKADAPPNDANLGTAPEATTAENKLQDGPKVLTYMHYAGEWQRELHPNWPEKRFHPPENIPHGWIYYARKGTHMGFGHTAIVELTPQRHIVKTPKPNPYDLGAQERNRADVRAEYDVYQRIGPDCPYIPKLVAWDPETCCLSIEYLENGPLSTYLGNGPPETETGMEVDKIDVQPVHRRRWALQATRGLAALHAMDIVHSDLGPGNVLLGGDLNLRIADFASSCTVGTRYKVCAGERYVVPGWSFGKTPEFADDIFTLGCLVYFVMTSQEPHSDVESEFDVAKLYEEGKFPSVEGIECGGVIQGCWNGSLKSADKVLQQLLEVFGVDDDSLGQ